MLKNDFHTPTNAGGKNSSMSLLTKHASVKCVFFCSEGAWKITLKRKTTTNTPGSSPK